MSSKIGITEDLRAILATYGDGQVGIGEYEGDEMVVVDSQGTIEKIDAALLAVGGDNLEDYIEIGFGDEYTSCSQCGKLIRTTPDWYGWQPDYWITPGGDIFCADDVRRMCAQEYMESAINNPKVYVNERLANPADFEFVRREYQYRRGLHPGMNDDPRVVCAKLRSQGYDVVFTASPSRFYTNFWAWVRPDWTQGQHEDFDKCELWLTVLHDKSTDGRVTCAYKLVEYRTDTVIFSGDDFGIPVAHAHLPQGVFYELLGFLTYAEDNIGYFAETPEQIAWCASKDAEELRMLVYDFENAEPA